MTSQISTGLACSPSCRHVMISMVSSSVPRPPGSEMKASASFEHALLPAMHGIGDDQLGDRRVGHLATGEELRDDAGHHAARRQGGVSQDTHQADAPAAIDQSDAGVRQPSTKCLRCAAVCGIVPRSGAAEHGNGVDM